MKRFDSILAALNYYPNCPICNKELRINDKELADDYPYDYDRSLPMPKISFYLNQRNDEVMRIDPITNSVEIQIAHTDIDISSSGYFADYNAPVKSINAYGKSPYEIKGGFFMHALRINCQSCCQFSYALQVHVDLSSKKLAGVFLNSESITVEDGGVAYEIKNIYSTNITEYHYFSALGSSSKPITLPLVELDVYKPMDTINRIRKLLPFY